MARKRLLIFDLDGTINDSSPGIKYCFRRTGELYGINDLSDETLKYGLSGPFEDNISHILKLKGDEISKAINEYVKFYVAEGQNMSEIFPGVKESLIGLKNKGYLLAVATLMVEDYAIETLQGYGIFDLFETVNGASMTIPYTKVDLIEKCLMATETRPEDAVMIGDGIDDHRSAMYCGVDFVGVTYGYEMDKEYCLEHNLRFASDASEFIDMF